MIELIPCAELIPYLNQDDLINLIQVNKALNKIYLLYLNNFREWFFRKANIFHIELLYKFPNECHLTYKFKGIISEIVLKNRIPLEPHRMNEWLYFIPRLENFLKRGDIVEIISSTCFTFIYSGDLSDNYVLKTVSISEFSPIYWHGTYHYDYRKVKDICKEIQFYPIEQEEESHIYSHVGEYPINIGMKIKMLCFIIREADTCYLEAISRYQGPMDAICISNNYIN